jgi:hypothetical protein
MLWNQCNGHITTGQIFQIWKIPKRRSCENNSTDPFIYVDRMKLAVICVWKRQNIITAARNIRPIDRGRCMCSWIHASVTLLTSRSTGNIRTCTPSSRFQFACILPSRICRFHGAGKGEAGIYKCAKHFKHMGTILTRQSLFIWQCLLPFSPEPIVFSSVVQKHKN